MLPVYFFVPWWALRMPHGIWHQSIMGNACCSNILLRTLVGIADAAWNLALKASCALHAASILLRTLEGIEDAAWDLTLKASWILHDAGKLLYTSSYLKIEGIENAAWDLALKASWSLHAIPVILRTLKGIEDAAWALASKHHGHCMLLQYL
jgi:hypothetical protein